MHLGQVVFWLDVQSCFNISLFFIYNNNFDNYCEFHVLIWRIRFSFQIYRASDFWINKNQIECCLTSKHFTIIPFLCFKITNRMRNPWVGKLSPGGHRQWISPGPRSRLFTSVHSCSTAFSNLFIFSSVRTFLNYLPQTNVRLK